jgi:hypothetical protein
VRRIASKVADRSPGELALLALVSPFLLQEYRSFLLMHLRIPDDDLLLCVDLHGLLIERSVRR